MKVFALLFACLAVASAYPKNPKSIGCDVCTFVVTEIDKLITDDQTEADLIAAVEQLCGGLDAIFPGLGAQCDNLVETYLPQILEGLVQNQLSPSSVCGSLTLCP